MMMTASGRVQGSRPLRWRGGPRLRVLAILLLVAALWPALVLAQDGKAAKEMIAVLELDSAGASKIQAGAVTERLREEMLRSGAFTLVDRSQLEAVLNEQALQQTGCTSQECAVKVGRILGIRKIVSGKVTKLSNELWQLSTLMVDVETAETVRAETVIHEGNFVGLLKGGVGEMGQRLAGSAATSTNAAARGNGTLLEVTAPGDAQVRLNGRPEGFGPQRFEKLVPGSYEVEVRFPAARPWKQTVILLPGQPVKLAPEPQRLHVALLPVRRTGTWKTPLEEVRGWVTRALLMGTANAGLEASHSSHINGGSYPSNAGADLSAQTNLEDDPWAFFGGVDREFMLAEGRKLGVDLILAFNIDASKPEHGDWKAYLVDTKSGTLLEKKGTFPYFGGGTAAVAVGVQQLFEEGLQQR